jgi:hypothetical protein
VHATIVVDGASGLTPYILRNHDTKLRQALIELRQPEARSRLLTVVGTSGTGKTRTLYEAVKTVLPDWTVVKPADIDELTRILFDGIPGITVVWLDELQDFLINQGVEAARAIRRLLNDPENLPLLFAATTVLVIIDHLEDVEVGNIEDRIGSGAPARTRTTHTVGHRRGPSEQSLGRY